MHTYMLCLGAYMRLTKTGKWHNGHVYSLHAQTEYTHACVNGNLSTTTCTELLGLHSFLSTSILIPQRKRQKRKM